MHCSLIALNNGCTFANLSELLTARCKYCLHSVSVIITDANRLWESSGFFHYISFLSSPAYPLIKRIVRKTLSFSNVMANIWLPFFQTGIVDLTHILSISVFVKKSSNKSCRNILLSKTGAGSFHAFNWFHTEISMYFQLATLCFFLT